MYVCMYVCLCVCMGKYKVFTFEDGGVLGQGVVRVLGQGVAASGAPLEGGPLQALRDERHGLAGHVAAGILAEQVLQCLAAEHLGMMYVCMYVYMYA